MLGKLKPVHRGELRRLGVRIGFNLILQSCKTHAAAACAYLKDVLERLPSMTNHQVAQITPQTWAAGRKIKPAIAS